MKRLTIPLILFSAIIFSGCASQSEVDNLEGQISDLESEVSNLKDTIDECNNNIEDIQSYARSDYEDMGYAIESLQNCEY